MMKILFLVARGMIKNSVSFVMQLGSTGLRDDLQFLLEEDLSSINLCSLHCEMRNCEQLLGSLGLFAHRIGSLDELNEALSDHGPESCKGFPRITIKEKPGQHTAIERNTIEVASFSDISGLHCHAVKWTFSEGKYCRKFCRTK
ncbi:uncharacterized protein [Montipora capricornis]|uniref:uncharacterized protein isoform X2 n=1 Tax=Montipora capricornis TaxID=246305 RepID=UPI0035F15D30